MRLPFHFLLVFIILSGSIIYSVESNAQIIKLKGAPISITPTMPKFIGLAFEFPLNHRSSLALESLSYLLKSNHSGDGDYKGFLAKAGYRVYLTENYDWIGPFLSTSLSYLSTSTPNPDLPLYSIIEKGNRKGVGLGLMIGTKSKLSQKISIEFGLGYTSYYETTTGGRSTNPIYNSDIQTSSTGLRGEPQFSIAIGWIIKESSFID